METITIRISGMKDEQCVRLVANAIQDLPGIGHLEVSLEKGEACVEHGRFVSPDDILQAVVDAGYEAAC
ncbi:MAG: heavy-metal-associated domain-containing protein [Propionivibrio sp.]|uniref:heavy-metal-associated domain-containing protein n=1 Tax=Propionivibrio sp. TaxID=2212460 RepID=UPI001A438D01|nr:heavy metal-associated domain-containing protein [Propionivibrio sp.]MBL8414713.1 heavy-metal-associated domain-containing protein [Propionivibrio sp.]